MSGALALLCASALAGCVPRAPAPPAPPAPAAPGVAEMRLVEAAERAERSLAALSRALAAPGPATPLPRLDAVPAPLRQPVTLDWAGPLETLAAALARRAGYRFLAAGRPPARPAIVAVVADGEPLIAVLRDAGLQAGAAATLTLDAAGRAVLLDWTPPGEDG